jgi:manganese transport system substrate-binding protein
MPKFLFRCAKVAARTFARRQAAFSAATAAAVVLSLSLTACGGDASGNGGKDKPVVLTTFTVLADIARNVAGDKLTVESITKAGAEIHGYEPTPGDIRKASKADLILDNGLNLEAWFAQFVEGDVHQRGLLPGQAEPARVDVTAERADLCGQHGEGLLQA